MLALQLKNKIKNFKNISIQLRYNIKHVLLYSGRPSEYSRQYIEKRIFQIAKESNYYQLNSTSVIILLY